MTSSINLKKIISVGAALLLAIGGALGGSLPASAAVQTITGIDSQGTSANTQVVSLAVSSCNFGFGAPTALTTEIQDFTVAINSTPAIVVSGAKSGSYITLTLAQTLQSSDTVAVSYTQVNGTISCTSGDTIGNTTSTLTYQLPAAPAWDQGSTQVTSTSSTGASLNFQSDTSGSFIWTVRLASSAAPTSLSNVYTASYGVLDVAHSSNPAMISANTLKTVVVTGLSAGTSYKAYIRSTNFNGMLTSSLLEIPFTTTGGSQGSGTPSVAPGTPTISNGVATTGTAGVWVNPSQSLSGMWLLCTSSHTARTTGNPPADCGPLSATALTNQSATWIRTSTLTIASTFNKWVSCSGGNGCTTTAVSSSGMYLMWYESDGMSSSSSATVQIDGVQSSSVVSAPVLTPEQARNQIKPLPVIVQPLVAAIPVLNKPMVNAGGKLDLSAGDFSGLVSASISGKPLDLTLGAKGGLTITVPNGEAGKTADLFLKFSTGTVIIQDAIKYVAPVVVADVPTRPVSIAAGSTKLSQQTADQVRQAAFANMKNTTVSCVAYAANGSAAARAAALASAEQVCALAVKSNPALTATPVTVIVDKAKAKTEAVGIKVYKN